MSTQGAEPSGEQAEFPEEVRPAPPTSGFQGQLSCWVGPMQSCGQSQNLTQPGGSARGAAAAGVAGPGVVPQLLLCAGAVLGRDMGYLNPILCGFPWRRGML